MLLHPVLGHREQGGLQAGSFFLASGKSADIVTAVLALVEELDFGWRPYRRFVCVSTHQFPPFATLAV